MVDRFPEAFRRFEKRVDMDSFENYRELRAGFAHWAGFRWQNTYRQNRALMEMAQVRGIPDIFMPIDARMRISPPETGRRYRKRTVSVSKRKWKRRAIRIPKVKKSVKYYVKRGYSANRIHRKLKKRGIGIRRKTLLRYVREARKKSVKADSGKYTPKKYRRRKK